MRQKCDIRGPDACCHAKHLRQAGRDLIRGSLNNCVAIGGQSWESRNLFEVIIHIQQHEGIQLEVKAVR